MASVGQERLDGTSSDSQPSPESIRAELARILESAEFKATPRRRAMLKYLVGEMLAGRSHAIKGYAIGVSVFGRDEGFDPQSDPVVRLEARRLRRDLDSYYVSDGRSNRLRISIPKGHYIPSICLQEPDKDGLPEPAQDDAVLVTSAVATHPDAGVGNTVGNLPRWVTGVGLAGVLVIASLVYVLLDHWRAEAVGELPAHGPALMVLPFEARGDNPNNAFLAAGITDQVTTELSRFPDFRLYWPPGRFEQASVTDPMEVSGRLGISYIVAGSVSSEVSTVRISVRLVDVQTERILWTESYDRALKSDSLLETQSKIAAGIASALGQPYGVIRTLATNRLPSEFAPSISSYECVLRAYSYRRVFSNEIHAPILACLEEAVRRDPDYAEAWAMLGWLHLDAVRFGWVPDDDAGRAYDRALEAASHAVTLDGQNVLALKALSSIHHYMGNYKEGERLQRQALARNPNDPDTLAQLGWRLAVRGNFDEGIPYLQQAIERTVSPPGWYHHLIAIDHYMHGRYAEMLTAAKSGAIDGSGVSWSLIAIAHGALGNETAAHDALEKMAETSPLLGSDPATAYRRHHAIDDIVDALVSGLRKAGWTRSET